MAELVVRMRLDDWLFYPHRTQINACFLSHVVIVLALKVRANHVGTDSDTIKYVCVCSDKYS